MSPRPPSSPSPAASSSSNSNTSNKPAPVPSRFQPQYQQTPVDNDDGREDGKIKKAVKWVVGYESNAPSTISSGDYLREAGENPKAKVRSLAPLEDPQNSRKDEVRPAESARNADKDSFPTASSPASSLLTQVAAYVSSLFPFLQWITRYNTSWLIGDLIAGITVGMVLVPQSMSYARLAST
jgi:hypothetical protein